MPIIFSPVYTGFSILACVEVRSRSGRIYIMQKEENWWKIQSENVDEIFISILIKGKVIWFLFLDICLIFFHKKMEALGSRFTRKFHRFRVREAIEHRSKQIPQDTFAFKLPEDFCSWKSSIHFFSYTGHSKLMFWAPSICGFPQHGISLLNK